MLDLGTVISHAKNTPELLDPTVVSATVWLQDETEEQYIYRLEVRCPASQSSHACRALVGWTVIGSGYRPNNVSVTQYSKDFVNKDGWLSWLREFDSFELSEETSRGKLLVNVNRFKPKKKPNAPSMKLFKPKETLIMPKNVKTSQRRCGKCGKRGHNTRTCDKA
jgi:hypothetical protein